MAVTKAPDRSAPTTYKSPITWASNAYETAQSPYNMQAAYYAMGNTSPVSPYASRYDTSPMMQKYIPRDVAVQQGFAIGQRPDLYNSAAQKYADYNSSLTDAQKALSGTTPGNQAFKDSWTPQQLADYRAYEQLRRQYDQSQAGFNFHNPYGAAPTAVPRAPAPTSGIVAPVASAAPAPSPAPSPSPATQTPSTPQFNVSQYLQSLGINMQDVLARIQAYRPQ